MPSAANAYHRHDSGFSSLDKTDPLADFRDSVQESEISEKGLLTNVTPNEVHASHSVLDTCPTVTTEVSNTSDSSIENVDGETLETGAIRKFYPDLSNAISQQLDVVSTELYSCDLIERTKLDQILAISGISDLSKAIRVLNAALTKMESVSSKFHYFLQVLEKCGLREIAEQIRANFDEQSCACAEHKRRLSPIGGSDSELMCSTTHRPSSAGENAISRLRSRSLQAKKNYRRETSHPNHKITTKNSGSDVQDDVVQRQVRQLNIDVLKFNKENRMLQERIQEKDNIIKEMDATIKEQDITIKDLENDYQELLASYKNLELQNNLLLGHSQSLLSLNDQEDTDYPHALSRHTLRVRTLSGWAGCQACHRKGNTRCKESTV